MGDLFMERPQALSAGVFSTWLDGMRAALADDTGTDVPCGECDACCRASYFIHVRPDEGSALAAIPGELLFPAPGLSAGNVLLGYDEQGRCPMLRDDGCSIYAHRPLTCRTYDCRVFAAAGVAADRALVSKRTARWTFSYPNEDDRALHSAVQAAARFVQEHPSCFPGGEAPGNLVQVALLAIKVHGVFLGADDYRSRSRDSGADSQLVDAVIEARERFDAGRVNG
jgi:hypothetical protein